MQAAANLFLFRPATKPAPPAPIDCLQHPGPDYSLMKKFAPYLHPFDIAFTIPGGY
jgi:hypothetical protein